MARPRGVRRLFLFRWKRSWRSEAVDAELQHHLESRASQFQEEGYAPDEAMRLAEAAFGDVARYRAACMAEQRRGERMMRRSETLRDLWIDVLHAVRGIRKSPGFAVAMVLTLGLGIGANTAIFTVVDALLLKPIPYAQPDELYRLITKFPNGMGLFGLRYQGGRTLQEALGTEYPVGLTALMGGVRSDGSEAQEVVLGALTPGFTDLLGVAPEFGRPFNPDDAVPGSQAVVLLNHEYWAAAFGSSPDVLGQVVTIDSIPHTVVGVMPAGFRYPVVGKSDMWTVLGNDGAALGRPMRSVQVIMRIPEDQLGSATERVEALQPGISDQSPAGAAQTDWTAFLRPMNDHSTNPDTRRAVLVTAGAALLLLLVALVNAVNLMLVRGTTRQREVGIRLALGGGRGRVAGQMVMESVLLAVLGGAAAFLMAYVGIDGLMALAPSELSLFAQGDIKVDGRVLGFGAVLSLGAGLAAGIVPALHSVRSAAAVTARMGVYARTSRAMHRARGAMVVVQVALSLTLLFGAGVMGRSFARLMRVDPGFEPNGLVRLSLQLGASRYADVEQRRVFGDLLADRLADVAGVVDVGRATYVPLGTAVTFGDGLYVEGEEAPRETGELVLPIVSLAPGALSTLGTKLIAGRDFDPSTEPSEDVVILTAEMARRVGGTEAAAVGRRFALGKGDDYSTVVGVTGEMRLEGFESRYGGSGFIRRSDPRKPAMYMTFLLRTEAPLETVLPGVRAAVRAVDPGQPVTELASMEDDLAASAARPRFFLFLMGAFAVVALSLAGLGLFGVLAFVVSQRTREMGIRMALGAAAGDVRKLILAKGMFMTVTGLVVGAALSLYGAKALDGLLFETSYRDVLTLTLSGAVLVLVAAGASWIPAHRATRLDPARVLGSE